LLTSAAANGKVAKRAITIFSDFVRSTEITRYGRMSRLLPAAMADHAGFQCFDCDLAAIATNSISCAHTTCSARVCYLCISVVRKHEHDATTAATQCVANTPSRRPAASDKQHIGQSITHLTRRCTREDGLDEIDMLQRHKLAVRAVLDGEKQCTAAAWYRVSTTPLSRAVQLVNGGRAGTKRQAADTPPIAAAKQRRLIRRSGANPTLLPV